MPGAFAPLGSGSSQMRALVLASSTGSRRDFLMTRVSNITAFERNQSIIARGSNALIERHLDALRLNNILDPEIGHRLMKYAISSKPAFLA